MKTAIILHGMPSKEEYFNPQSPAQSNTHWLPWVQQQLIVQGILAQTPEMPEPYEPDYEKWKSVFEQCTIDQNTILIGHSCGGGFLIRWLSEHNVKVHKIALVAPWIDPSHAFAPKMFDKLHIRNIADCADALCLFISSDDEQEHLISADHIKKSIKGLQVQEFTNHGHFTFSDMQTEQFPELVDFLVS